VQGIGFSEVIPPHQLDAHIARIRAEGFPDYTVRPPGERALYSAIIFLEPFRDRNLRAFGFDMFSEPVRRAAMERARDTNIPVLSGKVELVQEAGNGVQAGTLMYVPVYRNDVAIDTVEQRRAALLGWAYSPYRMKDLLEGLLASWDDHKAKQVDLHIYDGLEPKADSLLYEAHQGGTHQIDPLTFQRRTIDFNGKQWLLEFHAGEGVGNVSYASAWATLAAGILLSSLLCGLMFALARTQARASEIADTLTTELRRNADSLRESELRWKFALEGAGDGAWDWNVPQSTVFFSLRWKEMLGYSDADIGNGFDEWSKRVHHDDLPRIKADIQAHFDGTTPVYTSEHRVLCKDGSWKWILARGLVTERDTAGKPLRVVGTHTDITERKSNQEMLEHIAHYDSLTGLPNRVLLADRLHQAMTQTQRRKTILAVTFLDLDGFKAINDQYSHIAGDHLLAALAGHMKRALREGDTLARIGGDEFIAVLIDLPDVESSMPLLSRLLEAATETVDYEGNALRVSASMGVTIYPQAQAIDADQLMRQADQAMYQAKQSGKNRFQFFDAEHERNAHGRQKG